jgi:3-oxoacyl-[acyl-carrier protein] reductase
MNLNLDGRTIFVAGGSRGIGLGIVEACLAEGARVALTARGAEALEATRARLAEQHGDDRVWTMAGDMRDSATIDRALAEAEGALGRCGGPSRTSGCTPARPASRWTTRPGTPGSPRT